MDRMLTSAVGRLSPPQIRIMELRVRTRGLHTSCHGNDGVMTVTGSAIVYLRISLAADQWQRGFRTWCLRKYECKLTLGALSFSLQNLYKNHAAREYL